MAMSPTSRIATRVTRVATMAALLAAAASAFAQGASPAAPPVSPPAAPPGAPVGATPTAVAPSASSAAPAAGAPAATAPAVAEGPLAPLAWLAGCWRGSVNQREFREHWMPLRGNLMLGTGHTVSNGTTQDWEFMRLEARADGVHLVTSPSGKRETAFRFTAEAKDGDDAIFTFANPAQEFPQRMVYRRGTEGWLYAHAEGKVNGADRQVIYPMRRVDCETGEFIRR
jgi:hypothetical protein